MESTPPENDGSSSVGSQGMRSPRAKSKAASSVRRMEEFADGENGDDIRSDVQENASELARTIPIHTTGIVSTPCLEVSGSSCLMNVSRNTSLAPMTLPAPILNRMARRLATSGLFLARVTMGTNSGMRWYASDVLVRCHVLNGSRC